MESFIESGYFAGAKDGYVFKKGSRGLGYYIELGEGKRPRESVSSDAPKKAAKLPEKEDIEAEELDEPGVKRICLALEKRTTENLEKRVKHSNDPALFLESELALHEQLNSVKAIASVPQFYGVVASTSLPSSLTDALKHENSDISQDSLEILAELLDEDTLAEYPQESDMLVKKLLDAGLLSILAGNIVRFNEEEESGSQSVFRTMEVVETLVEALDDVAPAVMETPLLSFLLNRIQAKTHDRNKLYCTEILSILLTKPKCAEIFAIEGVAEENNMERLLIAISKTSKVDPSSQEEEEVIANLFGALQGALLAQAGKTAFDEMEGFHLMIKIVRLRKYAYEHALKVLASATDEFTKGCESLVEAGGLSAIFPIFMGRSIGIKLNSTIDDTEQRIKQKRVLKKRRNELKRSVTTSALSIIFALFVNLQSDSVSFLRLLRKFKEEGMEKCDRLVELHMEFYTSVSQASAAGIDSEDVYLAQVEAGIEVLQSVDTCLAILLCEGQGEVRLRIRKQFRENRLDLHQVLETVKEFGEDLTGADEQKLSSNRTANRISSLIARVEKSRK